MKTVTYKVILTILLVLTLVGMSGDICVAEVGYHAELENPPSFVSPYFVLSKPFSISLSSSSFPSLSRDWERSPKVVHSSSDSLSLRFSTIYYGRGTSAKRLIPVSVDAVPYSQGQRERLLLAKMKTSSARRMNAPQRGQRRRGLGITVPLPKRLDNIFGEGGAGLRVSGFRRITLSGRSQWTDAADNDLYRQNKFPSLAMEQVSKFDISGTIGSKITVKVAQDNQTDIPLANRLQIRYKGDEDEILKTIEAGNTTLNLPNTKFVGYSSRIRGLFGIKVAAQLGGLKFTAIASQEKGSTEKATFSASGEEEATYIREYEYVQGRIFDLGIPSDTLSDTPRALQPNDRIVRLLIYEKAKDDLLEARVTEMHVNPADPSLYSTERVKDLKVMKLDETTQFNFQQDASKNLHYVVFASARTSSKDLGYYMEIERDGQTIKYGDITSDTLKLTLLYRQEREANPSQQTWNLMWRNCYRVPRGVDVEDIGLKVFKGLNGTERRTTNLDYQQPDGGTYLEILGLDQYKNGSLSDKLPDGMVDDRDDIFRKEWGLVILPHRRPFATDTTYADKGNVSTAPLAEQVPSIYDYKSMTEKSDNSQYYLMLSTRTRSSIIRLKKANIIEGSEKVMLNGHQLIRDTDYTIQYDFGQITLLTSGANDPNADISVDYEYAPFFAVQKKTLLGLRAEYDWSENFQFGATVLYKSDKAQERKPRVGQETAKMMVLDLDASLALKPQILTTLANALPLVETDRPSNLKISGEIAQSRPNPNVEGVAYVDDFESAIEDLSLSTSRVTWHKSSRPLQVQSEERKRGRMLWHAPSEPVQVDDVYDRDVAAGEGSLRTMRMIFRPNIKDTVFVSEDSLEISNLARPTWAGIMRYFGSRVDAKRAQLFEMRARVSDSTPPEGRLHFDFGRINEDANGNGISDSEDTYPEDEAASPEEDVGLFDTLPDHMEPLYNAATNTDPSGDNWYFLGAGKCPFPEDKCNQFENEESWNNNDSLYYEWLNGTEGNRVDVSVLGLPDKEALSSGGSEENDAYFSFYIDFGDPNDPFYWKNLEVEGTAKDSKPGDRISGPWRTYRIPIRDPSIDSTFVSDDVLEPEWSQIKHVRVWWESSSGQTVYDTIEVADWYFVQSNWQESVIYQHPSDSLADGATSFVVASISDDENSAFDPPVDPYHDPTTKVTEPLRGLLLEYSNLHKDDTCIATKDLMVIDRYSGYRRMEMYVYSTMKEADAGKVKLFFRLGRDAENFYEQQVMIKPTAHLPRDSAWDKTNYINIDFNEITALKDRMLKADTMEISEGRYRVKGNPNINEVRYFAVGLVNEDTDSEPSLQSGQVWLDELRVTDVRRDVGMAGRLSVSGTIADLASVNFSYQSQDPFFRGLSTATRGGGDSNLGSGKTATSYSFSSTFHFDKFFPRAWGARVPITFGRTKSVTTPLLRTNSDIVLPEAVRKAEESTSESSNFQISESFNKKGGNLLFNVLLNRLTSSFSYRRNLSRSITRPYNLGENYNINSGFNFGITKVPSLPVFFWTKPIPILKKLAGSELSLYPSTWRTSATYTRNLTISDDVNHVRRSSLVRNFTGNMDITYKVFPNLTTTYKYSTRRDLSDPGLVRLSLKDFKLGLETNYNQSFTSNYNPKLLAFLTSTLTYNASYRDSFNRSSKTRQSSLSTNVGVSGTFNHNKLLGRGGPQRGGQGRSRGPFESRRRDQENKGTVPDSEKEKEKGSGTPIYTYPAKLLRLMTGWIRPISYRYNRLFSKSVPGIAERPSWKYRFGLTRDPEVDIVDETRFPNASESFSYDLSSGFKLLGGIDTQVKFKQTIKRALISQGARREDISTAWPDLTIRIQKFQKFPLIKGVLNKFIDVFAPRTGYSRQTKEARNLDDDFTTSRSVAVSHNPLLSINFKVMRALSLSASWTLIKNRDETFNPTTGVKESVKKSQRKGIALATKYSFSAPGGISIPLFGKLKFKSTMNIELNLKLNSSLTEVSKTGGPFATSIDKSEFSIIPVVTYMFSQQIKGGLSARWQDTSDNKLGRKSHVRELRIWAELRF